MSPRVLFVDDDSHVLQGLRRALRREGYEILCAASAIEALGLLRGGPVDVVVSDQQMPGMPGVEFLAKVREIYPETERIILTGNATVDLAVRAINEGAVSRFITKPCRLEELTATIRQAIERRRLVLETKRLVAIVAEQTEILETLEAESPGITRVERDAEGRVVIDGEAGDLQQLLRKVGEQIERAERRLSPPVTAMGPRDQA